MTHLSRKVFKVLLQEYLLFEKSFVLLLGECFACFLAFCVELSVPRGSVQQSEHAKKILPVFVYVLQGLRCPVQVAPTFVLFGFSLLSSSTSDMLSDTERETEAHHKRLMSCLFQFCL
jgi:hypothetical protein